MNSTGPWKQFAVAFAMALILYVVAYSALEHRRTRNGPWVIDFTEDSAGSAKITINQIALGISNLQLSFTNHPAVATNAHVAFAVPKEVPYDVPFGRCMFIDTTFQPGTIAFDFFGHEVQLMPRALTLDRQEIPWKSDVVIALTNRPILVGMTNITTGSK